MSRVDLRVATRGSALARRQTATVVEGLEDRRHDVEVVEVETKGDRVRDELVENLGTTGAFVRALDERVLDGEADLAVHSMKDVPTESPDDLVVAAVPRRASPRDVLVTPDGHTVADLPEGAIVGTASLRRRAQLLAERPDLTVEPVRGNVDTRVEKLLAPALQAKHERRLAAEEGDGPDDESASGDDESDDGQEGETEAADADGDGDTEFAESAEEWFNGLAEVERRALGREVDTEFDAVVLAEAGLERSGLADALDYQRLDPAEFVPAPGQGALAVAAPDGDVAQRVNEVLDHPRSRIETTAERVVLETVGGGCIAPVGVHAVLQGEYVHVTARVLAADGTEEVRATRDLPVGEYAAAARGFGETLGERGATDLVEAAARPAADDGEGT
jgi:hydroxymethylbilane synthase